MSNQLLIYFPAIKVALPQVRVRYDIRRLACQLPDVRYTFAEQSLNNCLVNPIRSAGGGRVKSSPLPHRIFSLAHLILELHYCTLGTFPKK